MTPGFTLLYVDSPVASGAFYAGILDRAPVEQSETFCLFALDNGAMLGLWSRHTVTPAAAHTGGGCELAFPVADLDPVLADWRARGIAILQEPVELDFGRSFVALDPDGHRLRVMVLAGG